MNGQPNDHHEIGSEPTDLSARKAAHINICADPTLPVEGGDSGFSQVHFVHRSLPELNAADIDCTTNFLGYMLSAPILISCMTGGSDQGYELNRVLAQGAQELGFAVGTGSLRILLRKPQVIDHFRLKELAPDVPLIGNIGAVQLPQLLASVDDSGGELNRFLSIIEELKLDALALHLNPGQELFQEEGDRDFFGILESIHKFSHICTVPLIAKETGAGIGPAEARALFSAGVAYVDLAGSGGTNWMSVESLREHPDNAADELEDFADWGIPSAVCLGAAARQEKGPLISSGGLRSSGDIAKSIAMGAQIAAAALPFMRAAREGGLAGLTNYGTKLIRGLKRTMLLTGCRTIEDLHHASLIIEPALEDAISQLSKAQQDLKIDVPKPGFSADTEHLSGQTGHSDTSVLEHRQFRRYDIHQRRRLLAADTVLQLKKSDFDATSADSELLDLADVMVENAVGFTPVPLGIGRNFLIDGMKVNIPMATEEPSVIAAASYAAGIIARHGGFETWSSDPIIDAHVYLEYPQDAYPTADEQDEIAKRIMQSENDLQMHTHSFLQTMTARGGGYRGISLTWLPEVFCLRAQVQIDVRDAMGANIANSIAESLKQPLAELSGARGLLAILSNQGASRRAGARFSIPVESLGRGGFSGLEHAQRICALVNIADADPARAVTHNKGIMNGISAFALATANDTRAIEAGAHAWASRSGQYRSLSQFSIEDGMLCGSLEMPLAIGTVGGATNFHPAARTALQIVGSNNAQNLARFAAALGLAQNFAALSALAGEGIQQGHMGLHGGRLAYSVGARGPEIPAVKAGLQKLGKYNSESAVQILKQVRSGDGEYINKGTTA